ncbi:MAG: trypsin-like serine protease [Myxococcales bacterium]|nr:trypsin-like serine protease [Myxococcales bacterium]
MLAAGTFAGGCVEPGAEPSLGTTGDAIIGGAPTGTGLYPAIGAIYEGGVICTGTLIAPDAVLSAAHCFQEGAPPPAFTLDHDARGAVTTIAGAAVVMHPMWDIDRPIGDGPQLYYDLAILRLAEPVTGVEPLPIPSAREAATLADGMMVTLVGYGETVDGDPASAGLKVDAEAPIVARSPSELQISNPGEAQNCYGDSGGPAIVDLGEGPRVVGVVSRGATAVPTCDQGGVDTRVDYYQRWIRQQVPAACVGGQACAGGTDPPLPDPDAGLGAEITGGCAAGGRGDGGAAIALVVLAAAVRRRRRAIE